jgi:hypothetical protein
MPSYFYSNSNSRMAIPLLFDKFKLSQGDVQDYNISTAAGSDEGMVGLHIQQKEGRIPFTIYEY